MSIAAAGSGGTLTLAYAAEIARGLIGAGLESLLAAAINQRHTAAIQAALSRDGLVLWATVPDRTAETRALAIVIERDGHDIHVHEFAPSQRPKIPPFATAQPDPFLEQDRA